MLMHVVERTLLKLSLNVMLNSLSCSFISLFISFLIFKRGRHCYDRMVVGFINTCGISVYHHLRCEFESRSWRGLLATALIM
jgi:hypothetical protein